MGETKIGNIVPRAGVKPTSQAFRASVLPFHHVASLTSLLYPRPPVYAAPWLRGQCRLLHSCPWNSKYFSAYRQWFYIYTYIRRLNNHTAHSLYRIMDTATSVMGVMKMGNTMFKAGLKPTSLASRASVLPLHHVGFPDVIPTCLSRSLPQRSVQTTTLL